MNHDHSIAIMGTGDELIQGDIVNSNTQKIAEKIHTHNLKAGMQLVVADEITAMIASLQFLLARHAVVITIGGLGPTSDDITRNAVSQALGITLEFDIKSWERLALRFKTAKLPLTDNNKQQCFFPASSTILINEYGSANGCMVVANGKTIVMLPGPPRECLPMFTQKVLPTLLKSRSTLSLYRYRAILLNVSESAVADNLDSLLNLPSVEVGYRCYYPYLDVKLSSDSQDDLQSAVTFFQQQYENCIISEKAQVASEQLRHRLIERQLCVSFDDAITAGLWQQKLVCVPLKSNLYWQGNTEGKVVDMQVKLWGLEQFWLSHAEEFDELHCDITINEKVYTFKKTLRIRGEETLVAAMEWASYFCLQALDKRG